MPIPSNENYNAANLIGLGPRAELQRIANIEGILLYGPLDPQWLPDQEARKLSVFAYDENGNPGFLNLNRLTNFVPFALELDGPPVDGALLYTVTGTVSYESGGGINYAIPGSFPRIPDYNSKDAFSTTGTILPDINDAVDLPYAQGYFDGVYYRLDLKTPEGISRFFSIDPSPDSGIQDADNWTGYGSETNPNTISITPPQSATVADPGQFIEDTTDQNSSYIKGWTRLHRFPEIDQYGFLKVNGMIPRFVTAAQLNNIPKLRELVILSEHSNCWVYGDGVNTVSSLPWNGVHKVNVDASWVTANPAVGGEFIIGSNAARLEVIVSVNLGGGGLKFLSIRKADATNYTAQDRNLFSVRFTVSQSPDVYLNLKSISWIYDSPASSALYMYNPQSGAYLFSDRERVLYYDGMTPDSGP